VIRLGSKASGSAQGRVNEPAQVDDRHRPHHPAQREALAIRRDLSGLGRGRMPEADCPFCKLIGYTPSCHSSRSRSNTASTRTSPIRLPARRPPPQSLCHDHTQTVVTDDPQLTGANLQERLAAVQRHHLVPNTRDGVSFKDGIMVTGDDNHVDRLTDERVGACFTSRRNFAAFANLPDCQSGALAVGDRAPASHFARHSQRAWSSRLSSCSDRGLNAWLMASAERRS
jgi:hypothetical protein